MGDSWNAPAPQEITADARVVYDLVVPQHGRALLATDHNTTVAAADMRRPSEVLEHPQTSKIIDFSQPVGVLMIAMVHFLTMDERGAVMTQLRDSLPSGSHLTLTHVSRDGHPADAVAAIEDVYAATPTPIYFREHAEVAGFFEGFELVPPGLVTIDTWHPDPDDPAPEATRWLYGGVGRKP